MIYQRHIPRDELITAQLEMLLQNGRTATILMQLVCVVGAAMVFWPYMALNSALLGADVDIEAKVPCEPAALRLCSSRVL